MHVPAVPAVSPDCNCNGTALVFVQQEAICGQEFATDEGCSSADD